MRAADDLTAWSLAENGTISAVGGAWDADRQTYTFDVVSGVTAIARFPFTDVPAGSWYYGAAAYAYNNGLFAGTTATTFAPDMTMTRAMLVAVLHRLAGSPSVSGKMPFTDVEADTWYTEAVLWAYQNGIVAGTSDTTFAPQSNITREQIVAIFSRYTAKFAPDKAKAAAELTAFADSASVSDWAVNDMKWAVAQKIISGSENAGKFYLLPQDNASRAQVATILMQYCAL